MIPAAVLSCHTIGLCIIRCLGIMGIPVNAFYYEKEDMGYVSKYVENRVFTPHPGEEEKDFISLLREYGRKDEKSVLFPADDFTLTAVSRNKELLSESYTVACPDWDVAKKYVDKKYTYDLAESIGVPSPTSIFIQSIEEIEKSRDSLNYPCLLKPCVSHRYYDAFGMKMVKVFNHDQLVAEFKRAKSVGIDVLLQEYIPGGIDRGVNYNSYFKNGKPIAEITARKVRMGPSEFGVPRVVRSDLIPEIIEPGRQVLKALNFNGYSCMEFKQDPRDGVYKLLEVNGRHNRSGLLSLSCGINFPYIEYLDLTGKRGQFPLNFKTNVYWIDEASDVSYTLKYFRHEPYSPL
jgi:D-aspartate ligase